MPTKIMTRLLAGTALSALLTGAAMGAEARPYDIAAQDAATALQTYAIQSGRQVLFPYEAAKGKKAPEIRGDYSDQEVLALLAASAGLHVTADDGKTVTLRPQVMQGAAGGGAAEVEALIVTAQKREENIQDVPIAISAFTAKDLEEQKIEGGFDLLKAIPNVTFSKNNFSSYNFSIRGIGTKAVSATTDPGVAVSFNNIALIQNRLFEQEYFDVERVEVLRGPQGTLYGRNATAGVINVISAKPDMDEFEGWLKGEVGNYDARRISAMVNVPLVNDVLALRLAGAITQRDGYDFNTVTENSVNGRELWSIRATVGFTPTKNISANLIWERFEEDDNRSRTGKQLCHRDDGPTHIGTKALATGMYDDFDYTPYRRALFSQGCKPGSLYDANAFGTPNGLAIPFVWTPMVMHDLYTAYWDLDGKPHRFIRTGDPYAGLTQSTNMREIASVRDPIYRANADLFELNVEVDVGGGLTAFSQTAYNKDEVYSFQDFNRFNTEPIFNDTSEWSPNIYSRFDYSRLAPGGYFCDPQIGCSNTIAGFDISKASGRQFTQELRLQSDWDGPLNFSAGANYTRFNTLVDYYVMYNLLTAISVLPMFNHSYPDSPVDPANRSFPCNKAGFDGDSVVEWPIDHGDPMAFCVYVDPGSLETMDGEGHNYFRSKNPYKLKSAAAFGELYWNARDDLKVTAGLRYTDDRKTFIPVPTQVLLSRGFLGGGAVNKGYPERPAIEQHWGEWTGRLGVDWKPELSFTDDTMVYAFYSRGYKGGGANPPTPGFATEAEGIQQLEEMGAGPFWRSLVPVLPFAERGYGDTFKPEFVNAFEVGAKNTLLDGALTFNTGAFFYDYTDYQVSQIRDRTAVNENFDAQIWGLEFETAFAPSPNFRMIANLGYLDTKIGDGAKSIDTMNRTQSNPNWTLVKPWLQYPSNCVVPTPVVQRWAETWDLAQNYWRLCTAEMGGIMGFISGPVFDPTLNKPFDINDYPEGNGGAGVWDDLSGNELPNSPHWTANIGAQYGFDFVEGWRATIRGDAYWQSQSWARVYNAVNDKLHGWYNANLSLWIENDEGLKIELYAKNILDEQPITDAFINSDDTALTTNVFTLDPRLIGLSIRQEF